MPPRRCTESYCLSVLFIDAHFIHYFKGPFTFEQSRLFITQFSEVIN